MLLIAKDDSAIGFHTRICTAETLESTVWDAMFVGPVDHTEHADEVAAVVAGLLGDGYVHFEDGWIELRKDTADIVEFFEAKLTEAKDEATFEDARRFEELKARRGAEEQYQQLRDALKLAIGNGAKAANLRYTLETSK